MAKKEATKSAAAKNRKPKEKIMVPDEAMQVIGPYILERLDSAKDLKKTIGYLKTDVEYAAEFLQDLDDDVTYGELDLLSEGGWTQHVEEKLRKIYGAKPGMTRIDGEPRVIYA